MRILSLYLLYQVFFFVVVAFLVVVALVVVFAVVSFVEDLSEEEVFFASCSLSHLL